MSSSEIAWQALYNRLEEVLGPEHAETLMTRFQSQPTGELLTRSDIADLRSDLGGLATRLVGVEGRLDGLDARVGGLDGRFDRMEARFDLMDERIDRLQETLRDQFRNYTFITLGSLTALTAIFSAVVMIAL